MFNQTKMVPLNYNSSTNVPMEVEHRFDLEWIGNYGYYMEEELRNVGWIKVLDLDLKVYPGLITQFMANVYTHGNIIFSTVLNMHVRVDLLSISKAIDCENVVLPYYIDWINENHSIDSFLLHEDAPRESEL